MSKISQLFPPSPAFTETSLPDLAGKVFVITGATSGVGLELARMLYAANGTVYVGGRDEEKIRDCIAGIISQAQSSPSGSGSGPESTSQSQCQPNSKITTITTKTESGGGKERGKGNIHPFKVDLSNLPTIPPAVASFLAKESRLDGLIHNAGVMNPPPERSVSEQGHEVQMATHCLGPFLLTGLLSGLLGRTASSSLDSSSLGSSTSAPALSFLSPSAPAPAAPPSMAAAAVEKGHGGRGGGKGNVGPRVVWVSSMISLGAPKGGIVWDDDDEGDDVGGGKGGGRPKLAKASMENYMQSKVGSVFLAHEYAKRLGRDGVISVVSISFLFSHFSPLPFFCFCSFSLSVSLSPSLSLTHYGLPLYLPFPVLPFPVLPFSVLPFPVPPHLHRPTDKR